MKCPKCGMELIGVNYQGIKVDKRWACEGIWLDAGELEAVSRFEKTALQWAFRTEALSLAEWVKIGLVALTVVIAVEVDKAIRRNKKSSADNHRVAPFKK